MSYHLITIVKKVNDWLVHFLIRALKQLVITTPMLYCLLVCVLTGNVKVLMARDFVSVLLRYYTYLVCCL